MSAPLPQHGDHVLIRAVVRQPINGGRMLADFTVDNCLPLELADIVAIERANFKVGDRVIAGHIHGEILCIADNQLWVRPDNGNRVPSTFEAALCKREPAPAPSAEILPFQDAAPVRPCDTEDTAA